MAQQASPSGRTIYCRGCGYALTGLTEHRCPECGRAFDPVNTRSYRTRPMDWRWTLKRWLVRSAATAAVLLVLVAVAAGWLYRRYVPERRVLGRIQSKVSMTTERPELSLPLKHRLGFLWRWGVPLPRTVTQITLQSPTDADINCLREFSNLEDVSLHNYRMTEAGAGHLKAVAKLKALRLNGSGVGDESLRLISALDRVQSLNLYGTQVTDAGLDDLKKLEHFTDRCSDKEPRASARAACRTRLNATFNREML